MSHARRYHEPGVGSRTGMRIAEGAFDLDDFFQAGRRALVGGRSPGKSVPRSSITSTQSDPSPRKSLAGWEGRRSGSSGMALENSSVPTPRSVVLRQSMRVSSDPFASSHASSSSMHERQPRPSSKLSMGAPRSALSVVNANSTSEATGPSSPTVWAVHGLSSSQKSRPELNAGLEARRLARLEKIHNRQQRQRFRKKSATPYESDHTVQTLRGDELSYSTVGRTTMTGAREGEEQEEEQDEDHEEEQGEEQEDEVEQSDISERGDPSAPGGESEPDEQPEEVETERDSDMSIENLQSEHISRSIQHDRDGASHDEEEAMSHEEEECTTSEDEPAAMPGDDYASEYDVEEEAVEGVPEQEETASIGHETSLARHRYEEADEDRNITPTIARPKAKRQRMAASRAQQIERVASRNRDAAADEQDGVRRGSRFRYAPLEYWRGERARYGRPSLPKTRETGAVGDDTIEADAFEDQVLAAPPPVAVLKEIIRVPRAEGEGTFSGLKLPSARSQTGDAALHPKRKTGSRKGGEGKPDPLGPTRHAEDGWDNDTATHADVLDASSGEEIKRQIACTSAQLRPRMAAGCTFGFEKVFVIEDFMATGMLFLLVDGEKPTKNSKDNYYTFTVLEGCVRVVLHQTEFVVAPQGMFFVPRGNDYSIANVSKRVARLAFTQAKRPQTAQPPTSE